MPLSLKEQAEYGDDLAVVFVEVQGHPIEEVEKFALKNKWLGGSSLWTTERPMAMQGNGIPHFILLDVEGRQILEGNPLSVAKQVTEAIKEQVAIRQHGPKDLPKDLRGIWKDRARGKYADAIAAAQKLIDRRSGDDAAVADAAASMLAGTRIAAEVAVVRVERMIERGDLLAADDMIEDLARGSDGDESLEARVKEVRAKLASDDLKPERDAAKALAKLERLISENGTDAVPVRTLTKFASRHAGTKAAERAVHLATLIGS